MNLPKFNKLSNFVITYKIVSLIFLGKAELFIIVFKATEKRLQLKITHQTSVTSQYTTFTT